MSAAVAILAAAAWALAAADRVAIHPVGPKLRACTADGAGQR